MDDLNLQNKAAILCLCYGGETRSWGIVKYVNAHKQQHHAQAKLHNDHGFNDIEDREKVTMLINGIKTGEYDTAVLSINSDTSGARNNFEKAQLRLLEYKSLIDERKRNQRNVSSVEGRGRGSGGCGRGRSGPGRGEAGLMAFPAPFGHHQSLHTCQHSWRPGLERRQAPQRILGQCSDLTGHT